MLIKKDSALDILDQFEDAIENGERNFYGPAREMIINDKLELSNHDWIEFLSQQFDVNKTTAREMIHKLMIIKSVDNIKNELS